MLNILACLYQIACTAADFVINLCTSLVDVLVKAVEQRNTHRDCPHVKVFVVDHIYGFKYILGFKHKYIPLKSHLNLMHTVKDVLVHNVNFGVGSFAYLVEIVAQLVKSDG